MADQYHNPFASMDLIAPIEHRDFYDWYCQTGGNTSVDRSPFPVWSTFGSLDYRLQLIGNSSQLIYLDRKPLNLLKDQSLTEIVGGSKR